MSYYFDEERGRYFRVVNGSVPGNSQVSRYHNNSIQVEKRTEEFRKEEERLKNPVKKKTKKLSKRKVRGVVEDANKWAQVQLRKRILDPSNGLLNLSLGLYDCSSPFNYSGFDWKLPEFEQFIIKEPYLGSFGSYSIHKGRESTFEFYLGEENILSLSIPVSHSSHTPHQDELLKFETADSVNIASYPSENNGVTSGLFLVGLVVDRHSYTALFYLSFIGTTPTVLNYTALLFRFLKQRSSFGQCELLQDSSMSKEELISQTNYQLSISKDSSAEIVDHYLRMSGRRDDLRYKYIPSNILAKQISVFVTESDLIIVVDGKVTKVKYWLGKYPTFNSYHTCHSLKTPQLVIDHRYIHYFHKNIIQSVYNFQTKAKISISVSSNINHVIPLGSNKLFIVTKMGIQRATINNGEYSIVEEVGPLLNNTKSIQIVSKFGENIVINEDLNTLIVYNTTRISEFGLEKRRVSVPAPAGAFKLSGMVKCGKKIRLLYMRN